MTESFNTYVEAGLGTDSGDLFLRLALEVLGYEHRGPRTLTGVSGLAHEVDAVGLRDKNLVLVFLRGGTSDRSPAEATEEWARAALLKFYDIKGVFEAEGMSVDSLFLENIFTRGLPDIRDLERGSVANLPPDLRHLISSSIHPIPRRPVSWTRSIAASVNACHLSLDDIGFADVCSIVHKKDSASLEKALKRVRVAQYFNPPTDELILTAVANQTRTSREKLDETVAKATAVGHEPSTNAVLQGVDYKDPIATAKALESHGMLSYEAEVRIQQPGLEIVHKISKTPQEHFVLRLLSAVNLSKLAKVVIEGLKGG